MTASPDPTNSDRARGLNEPLPPPRVVTITTTTTAPNATATVSVVGETDSGIRETLSGVIDGLSARGHVGVLRMYALFGPGCEKDNPDVIDFLVSEVPCGNGPLASAIADALGDREWSYKWDGDAPLPTPYEKIKQLEAELAEARLAAAVADGTATPEMLRDAGLLEGWTPDPDGTVHKLFIEGVWSAYCRRDRWGVMFSSASGRECGMLANLRAADAAVRKLLAEGEAAG